jgi:hypothetical protein
LHSGEIGVHPQDVRDQHLGGGERIGVQRLGVAAEFLKEAMELALGVMKSTGARPAVRAPVDRAVSATVSRRRQCIRGDVEGFVPIDGDERLAAALRGVTGAAVLIVAEADHRSRNARIRIL